MYALATRIQCLTRISQRVLIRQRPPLSPQTCACVDLSVDLSSAALELLRGTIEGAAEAAKEAVRAQLLRELDAEEEVRTTT